MLNRIPLSCYPDEEDYTSTVAFFRARYDEMSVEPERCVSGAILLLFSEDFDEEGMDKLVMLVAGMLWLIEHDALPDDDPHDVAYNTWYAICDFNTGDYDDLFTSEDLPLIKKDVKTLFNYFEEHPLLKGE